MTPKTEEHLHQTVIHYEMLPECVERNKRVEEKIDDLIEYSKSINGRYMKHIEESIEYRSRIMQMEKTVEDGSVHRRWLIGIAVSIVVTIIIQIITFVWLWGRMEKQVEVNTRRLELIESRHSSQDAEARHIVDLERKNGQLP